MTEHAQAPIRRSLMRMILLTSGAVLVLTCASFVTYEFLTFRQAMIGNLTTLGSIVADNSTAALAFDNREDAQEVLSALRADKHVEAAALYDGTGSLFARYPRDAAAADFPAISQAPGFRFESAHLVGVLPVVQGSNATLGTLYIRSGLGAVYERFRLYGLITALVIAIGALVAYVISGRLQRQVSQPLLSLAATARKVSDEHDYAVRATAADGLELSQLTQAFNHMLTHIQVQQEDSRNSARKLQAQLSRHELLNRITRAVGERQDLASTFQVVVRNLEDDLSIDFGCVCLYEPGAAELTVVSLGATGIPLALSLGLDEQSRLPIDENGLSRCVRGALVYEPDTREVSFEFPQRLAGVGLRSVVLAPLLTESRVFGVLVAARREEQAFSSADCEFIRQLSEHVALATHQVQLYNALQQAYDDLRQSQHTVMQQERLRALGQMASGIAHDINNAISPVTLYTESLLERETNLSDRAREYLVTIQRAIEDVAETVARMREFYRVREPQLQLVPVQLNRLIGQVLDLTRVRWSDEPQQRGVVIELRTELTPGLPEIMGAETEIRDALTNLVFNAVDAMPAGGTLTVRTTVLARPEPDDPESLRHIWVEVSDTGIGMDEETRRRCLEPFYTTKGERGTGLGLPMVYGMVKRHSADLQIDSQVGTGTTMRLVFAEATPQLAVAVRPSTPQSPGQRLRILIVDDDPLLIKSLRDTLEADGHEVTPADGGQKGIDCFAKSQESGEPFEIVITDLGMPYVDGRKVAAAIRAASPVVPIVMLTGWGQRLVAENDVPPHVNKVLNKPPKLHELRRTLAELTSAGTAS